MAQLTGKHADLTEIVISAFYAVYNALGYGFAEKVYHGAMFVELQQRHVNVKSEYPLPVYYHGVQVGDFYTDLIVNDVLIIELKAVKELIDEHRAQLLNYLKASTYEVGLLLNFGPAPKVERKVFDNANKGTLRWAHKPVPVVHEP
jgi:GxxExxY protein